MSIAVDAYICGYPLTTFDMARKQQTNVEKPDDQHASMNQMTQMRTYLPIGNHCCPAPNADTLSTIAWLDVYDEPLILSSTRAPLRRHLTANSPHLLIIRYILVPRNVNLTPEIRDWRIPLQSSYLFVYHYLFYVFQKLARQLRWVWQA
jgi:hypothetical protein